MAGALLGAGGSVALPDHLERTQHVIRGIQRLAKCGFHASAFLFEGSTLTRLLTCCVAMITLTGS